MARAIARAKVLDVTVESVEWLIRIARARRKLKRFQAMDERMCVRACVRVRERG